MTLDVIIVITIFYFFFTNNYRIKYLYKIPIYLRIILFIFISVVFLQMYNPYYYDIYTYIVGFRSYLLAIPIILIGYYFAKNRLLITQDMIKFILSLSIITFFYAVFQLMTDYTLIVGTAMEFIAPMEHGVHSHGDQGVQLASSLFASSKRFGHFLIIMYLIYVGISLSKNKKINFMIIIFFGVALIVSGARESFVLFIFTNLILMIKFMRIKGWLLLSVVSTVVIGLFVLYASDDLIFKIDFMLSEPGEYLRRIYQFLPFLYQDFNNPYMLFGLGVGKYGQEALLNPELLSLTYGMDKVFFHDSSFFSGAYGFMDSGLAKISIELGFFGISIYLLFLIYILYLAIKNIIYLSEDKLKLSFSIFIITWTVYMMKAHPNISDIFMSYFLFFSIGYISYKEKMEFKYENN
jgi:hypothetical protein